LKSDETNSFRGLLDVHPIASLENRLVVQGHEAKWPDGRGRYYIYWMSHLEFGIWNLKQPEETRTFSEVIFGMHGQKPHFDIDFSSDQNDGQQYFSNVVSKVIEGIINTLAAYQINLNVNRELLIFDSSGISEETGKMKYSCHIVIDRWFHASHLEAKAFALKVVERLLPSEKLLVDMSVYSSTQHFRIVGQRKYGSKRIKQLMESWSFGGYSGSYEYEETPINERHRYQMLLSASLISNTYNCHLLPSFIPIDQLETQNRRNLEIQQFDEEFGDQAFEFFKNYCEKNSWKQAFKFVGIEGGLVLLKRKSSSFCQICQRIHDNSDPFLRIGGKQEDDELPIYYYCRRAEGKFLHLGHIRGAGQKPVEEVKTTEVVKAVEEVKTSEVVKPVVKVKVRLENRVAEVLQKQGGVRSMVRAVKNAGYEKMQTIVIQWDPIWTVLNRNATFHTYTIRESQQYVNYFIAALQLFGHMDNKRVQQQVANTTFVKQFSQRVSGIQPMHLPEGYQPPEAYAALRELRNADGVELLPQKSMFIAFEIFGEGPPQRWFYAFDNVDEFNDAEEAIENAMNILREKNQLYGRLL
jgi:hypothetical protein